MLPSFWVPFIAIFLLCFVLCCREDIIHGPQKPGAEDSWTPRYRFLIRHMGRLTVLAAICLFVQFIEWASRTSQ